MTTLAPARTGCGILRNGVSSIPSNTSGTAPLCSRSAKSPGGMHLLETEFIAEVIDPQTTKPVADGTFSELVWTNLGRAARPIIRYPTGDLVRMVRNVRCLCGRADAIFVGGITWL